MIILAPIMWQAFTCLEIANTLSYTIERGKYRGPNSDLVWVRKECVSGSKREDVRRLFLREECELNIAMRTREESSYLKKKMH